MRGVIIKKSSGGGISLLTALERKSKIAPYIFLPGCTEFNSKPKQTKL